MSAEASVTSGLNRGMRIERTYGKALETRQGHANLAYIGKSNRSFRSKQRHAHSAYIRKKNIRSFRSKQRHAQIYGKASVASGLNRGMRIQQTYGKASEASGLNRVMRFEQT
ncbi:hypothetical protein ElyMa_005643900 [Elysia marginata]|uniref:Uncharacterized protein n=1 Tax=Elysia marginata TaxID=1093978 RepID=A0AAV4FBE0_9GAST|nr:hypothetical protein ElyMa_005643900 [Elysia marginata]